MLPPHLWRHPLTSALTPLTFLLYISFAVSSLSQYLDTPCTTHLHYLPGTKNHKLTLVGINTTITSYSDSDWASQIHCHSISGFAFFIGMGIVSWRLKKQPIVTLSSTKAEYVTLMHCSKDIIWIHKLLIDFSTILPTTLPMTLYCDNQGMLHLSKDSTFHCPTNNMIVDTFTKPLACFKLKKFCQLLSVLWSHAILEGECLYLPHGQCLYGTKHHHLPSPNYISTFCPHHFLP